MADPTTTDPTEPTTVALPHWLRLANLPFSTKLSSALLQVFYNDPQAIFHASHRGLDAGLPWPSLGGVNRGL